MGRLSLVKGCLPRGQVASGGRNLTWVLPAKPWVLAQGRVSFTNSQHTCSCLTVVEDLAVTKVKRVFPDKFNTTVTCCVLLSTARFDS